MYYEQKREKSKQKYTFQQLLEITFQVDQIDFNFVFCVWHFVLFHSNSKLMVLSHQSVIFSFMSLQDAFEFWQFTKPFCGNCLRPFEKIKQGQKRKDNPKL